MSPSPDTGKTAATTEDGFDQVIHALVRLRIAYQGHVAALRRIIEGSQT